MTTDASRTFSKIALSPKVTVARAAQRIRVSWGAIARHEDVMRDVQIWDISDSGVSFVSDLMFPLGTPLSLVLQVPSQDMSGSKIAAPLDVIICNSILTRNGFRIGARVDAMAAASVQLLKALYARFAALKA